MTHTLNLWFDQALLPEGWARSVRFEIAMGRIHRIDSGGEARPGDEIGTIALPGLNNLHSHAFQRAMAGHTETDNSGADSFWSWRAEMYRLVERLTPEAVHAITAMAYVEMVEAGFTRVGEFHYLHHDPLGQSYADPAEMAKSVLRAAQDTGIGMTLLPVFYAHSGFGGLAPIASQRRFIHKVETYADLITACRQSADADTIIGIAPQSLRAVTQEELIALLPLAESAPIHIHIAEQRVEVEACLAHTGTRPITWLMDHAPVDQDWCLVHATHINAEETLRLAQSGACAGLCPITEANLGDGLFAMPDYQAQNGVWGIGSDSNVRITAFDELQWLEYGQRLRSEKRNIISGLGSCGRSLFEGALRGGAQALGFTSGLAVGLSADMVAVKPVEASAEGLTGDRILDHLIFTRGFAIDQVWRAGICHVKNGRHTKRERIAMRFAEVLKALKP